MKHLNTLSFEFSFDYHNDEVYFANTYPYSYSDLNVYLDYVNQKPKINDIMRMYAFDIKSLAGNNIQCLVITDFTNEPEEISEREAIILSSRVHPGETSASYIIEGVIDFLLGKSKEARFLRKNFVFKIVPMINVDGVINGNTRTNLAGLDLNR